MVCCTIMKLLTFDNDELNCLCHFMIRETGLLTDMCTTSELKAENNIHFILGNPFYPGRVFFFALLFVIILWFDFHLSNLN